MENLSEISLEEFADIVLQTEDLRTQFSEYIQESEIEIYLGFKIACFERGILCYEYGTYCHSYMQVRKRYGYVDYSDAVQALIGVQKSIKDYGSSPELEKMAEYCNKLDGTNLFIYYVEKLVEKYFKEEFIPTIDWVEDMDYKLYCGEMPDDLAPALEIFQQTFDGYLYDRENKTYYKPCKIA